MKIVKTKFGNQPRGLWLGLLLAAILALLFWRSFLPGYVHFSNDGPLGQEMSGWLQLPQAFTGEWGDLNDTGNNNSTFPFDIDALIFWALGPIGHAKFFPPIALLILGIGAWAFFRQLKLSPTAAILGALAAALNSTFLGAVCWGVGSQEIAIGMDFFALALVMSNCAQTPVLIRWARIALAGFCVGVNVMEGADIGAILSIIIAVYVFLKTLADEDGSVLAKCARGVGSVVVLAAFAGFMATQTVVSLVGSQIQGIAGTGQDKQTKAAHWDWVTQWSEPKKETLGLFIPGLFGYRMDTPKDMMPALQDAYQGGVYWGGVGRTPEIDRFFDSGATGSPPSGPNDIMRFSGGGNYCGILVTLIAALAVAQSLRRQNSPFSDAQKKFIWFWAALVFASVLFSWGRFAPFYALLYKLPYFSTIRNPEKFLIFYSWGLVILFAYGIHSLRRQFDPAVPKSSGLVTQLQGWWKKAGAFDRKWTLACAGVFGMSVLGWLIYVAEKSDLVKYIEKVGYTDEGLAGQIAAFSIGQVGWFVALLAVAIVLLTLAIAGYFSGPRAMLGGTLLGALLFFDLGRADLPYIVHWNYINKYEVGALNPVIEFLRDKPYEHRVAALPFDAQQQLRDADNYFGGMGGIYRIEWAQHHFPYYNIQSLDLIQMPRMAANLQDYLEAFYPRTAAETPLIARHWQLTNTRYLLGAAGFLDAINQQLDPAQHRFRIAQRFDIVPKPGVARPTGLEDLTATLSPDGDLALFEFTGALPRAKLYSDWQVSTNDEANLKTLADLNFDPVKTVLISTPEKDLPAVATNENSGTVEFKSYTPKDIVFDAKATMPSVLLLNDKYDPNWRVTVDGKPAELLRCNFIMRGVYLSPGEHTVEFRFNLPHGPLYVTLTAIVMGICLCGCLYFVRKRAKTA